MNRVRITYLTALVGAMIWCGAILLAPVLAASHNPLAQVLYEFFRPLCHQIDQRSLHLDGAPLAVCARCSAIYGAFLIGIALYPLLRPLDRPALPGRRWLLAAALPMVLDVAAAFSGLHESTPVTRLITGALLGFALAWFCLPVALDAAAGGSLLSACSPPARKES